MENLLDKKQKLKEKIKFREEKLLNALIHSDFPLEYLVNALKKVIPDIKEGGIKKIFKISVSLMENNVRVTQASLYSHAHDDPGINEVAFDSYLSRVLNSHEGKTYDFDYEYKALLKEQASYRALEDIYKRVESIGGNGDDFEALKELKDNLNKNITNINHAEELKSINAVTIEVIGDIEKSYLTPGQISGVETGFVELDKMTSGLQKGDLIVLAARPSMGKTSFAMNIVEHVAINGQKGVGVFSLEMPAKQISARIISSLSEVSMQSMRSGALNDEDFSKLTMATGKLSRAPILINDKSGITIDEIYSSVFKMDEQLKELKRQNGLNDETGLELLVVDYLQFIKTEGNNRVNEVGEISRGLKSIAKELNIPVLALSQLNRKVDDREDRRPVLSDLRDSGAIEQDADLIMFIYREAAYKRDGSKEAEIILAKHRNGEVGVVNLMFEPVYAKFSNLVAGFGEDGFYG